MVNYICGATEIWIPIKNHEGYEVSDFGRIRSVDRVITTVRGVERKLKGRVLKFVAFSEEHPYQQTQAGFGVNLRAHVVVAEAFLGPSVAGLYVCHKDGNPENNRADNLYYGTPQQNQLDRWVHGTRPFGESHNQAKLSDAKVSEIKKLLREGKSQTSISEKFGVSQALISNIYHRKVWAHVS